MRKLSFGRLLGPSLNLTQLGFVSVIRRKGMERERAKIGGNIYRLSIYLKREKREPKGEWRNFWAPFCSVSFFPSYLQYSTQGAADTASQSVCLSVMYDIRTDRPTDRPTDDDVDRSTEHCCIHSIQGVLVNVSDGNMGLTFYSLNTVQCSPLKRPSVKRPSRLSGHHFKIPNWYFSQNFPG